MYIASAAGEPYELLGITDDFTDEEKKRFWAGEGCACCVGKPVTWKKPFRCEMQEALESVLGDDHDGLAAEMEDAEAMFGTKFYE